MSLAKKSIANFIGGIVPAVASLLTVPIIVSRLGAVEYGLFTLVTAVVGYFALIDINVTAGSVKYLSEHHAREEHEQINQVISFGGFIYFMIGLLGGLGIFMFADTLVSSFFNVPENLHVVARVTLQIASFAFFFSQIQVYLLSIPQSLQRYDISGKFESAFGALTSISTVLVVLFGGGLVEIMVVRLGLSIVNCGLLLHLVRKILPFAKLAYPDKDTIHKLASFSAYSYFSRIAEITHLNGDKLLLGALSNMQTVAFYSVPSLLVNRVFGLIHRLGRVIFPASSALAANNQHDDLRHIYLVSTRYYIYLNGSLCLLLSIFSRELLHYWAGSIFGSSAAQILVLIAATTFFDSLTNLPSLVSDGLGKPIYTSVLSVLRTASCMALGYFFIRSFGYIGIAWAYLLTSSFFAIAFLTFVHGRSIAISLQEVYQKSYQPTVLPLIALMTISLFLSQRAVLSFSWFFTMVLLLMITLAIYGWLVVCLPQHKPLLKAAVWRYLHLGVSRKI